MDRKGCTPAEETDRAVTLSKLLARTAVRRDMVVVTVTTSELL